MQESLALLEVGEKLVYSSSPVESVYSPQAAFCHETDGFLLCTAEDKSKVMFVPFCQAFI